MDVLSGTLVIEVAQRYGRGAADGPPMDIALTG